MEAGAGEGYPAMPIAYLLAVRAAIVAWVLIAVMPFEAIHDAIDAELQRQGIE
jgi:hypothetical protein